MANFYKLKGVTNKGLDEKKALQTLGVSEDAIVGLYGGGPAPDNKQLDVVSTDTSICSIVELDPIDYTHRRFRLIGKADGSCKIEARLGPAGPSWATLGVKIDATAAAPKQKIVPDLEYDGQQLRWPAVKLTFKATSGITASVDDPTEYRDAKQQCVKDHGPVPEGLYTFSTKEDRRTYARDNGAGTCTLSPASPIQVIPAADRQAMSRRAAQRGAANHTGRIGEPIASGWSRPITPRRRPVMEAAAGFTSTIRPRATRTDASKRSKGSFTSFRRS